MSTFHSLFPHWLDWLYRIIDWPMSTGTDGGYNLWSGIGIGILFPLVYWRRHTCHIHRCWRLQWHVDPAHGHPVCKRHHPLDPRQLTAEGTNE